MTYTPNFTSENTIQYLVEQIPEIIPYYERHKEYWKGKNTTIGIDIRVLCDIVEDSIITKNSLRLKKIFQLTEELIIFGDSKVNYAVTMMFLEDLIYISSNNPETVPYAAYIPLLGPKAKEFCCQLDVFWETNTPGLWNEGERIPNISWSYQETGSIAAALKAETRCIIAPDNKTHLQKCKDNVQILQKWLEDNSSIASSTDKAYAENCIQELQDAINEAEFMERVVAFNTGGSE